MHGEIIRRKRIKLRFCSEGFERAPPYKRHSRYLTFCSAANWTGLWPTHYASRVQATPPALSAMLTKGPKLPTECFNYTWRGSFYFIDMLKTVYALEWWLVYIKTNRVFQSTHQGNLSVYYFIRQKQGIIGWPRVIISLQIYPLKVESHRRALQNKHLFENP